MAENDNYSQLGGGIIGGIVGGLGDFFSSRERKKALRRFRRRQRTGIDEARERTESRVSDLLANPLIASASQFIQDSFSSDTDPLTEQFSKRLRVAQESRGLRRSVAGAVAEASSLAAFRQNFLQSLLPQAMEFGTVGERFRRGILAQEAPISVAYHTGSPLPGITPMLDDVSPIASGLAGAIRGFGAGQSIQNSFSQNRFQNELLESLRRNRGATTSNNSGLLSRLFGA